MSGAPGGLRRWLEGFVFESGFLARYPYYAHVLAQLEPVADPSVPAMGVSLHAGPNGMGARYYLHVNVEAMLREPQFVRGILLHEVHHVVLGHLAHPAYFGLEQRDLLQIAQETSANEFITEPLPAPVLWQHFAHLGLRAGQSTLERYALLCAARAEGKEPQLAEGTAMVDHHPQSEQAAPPPSGLPGTRELLEETIARGREDAERAAEVDPERALLAGRSPKALIEALASTHERPTYALDWREALRTFVARARAPVHSWSRPSRRFPERIGQIPGRAYRPRTVLRPTLLVAIDTSLSMSAKELSEIARQLRPMSELAQLVIVECDTEISRVQPFRGVLEEVKGRGGTDLRPVFAPRFLMTHRADGVVYFTDGEGPFPEAAPRVPVLWVLTKPTEFACPWGERAKLG